MMKSAPIFFAIASLAGLVPITMTGAQARAFASAPCRTPSPLPITATDAADAGVHALGGMYDRGQGFNEGGCPVIHAVGDQVAVLSRSLDILGKAAVRMDAKLGERLTQQAVVPPAEVAGAARQADIDRDAVAFLERP